VGGIVFGCTSTTGTNVALGYDSLTAIGAGLETKMGGVIVRGDYTLSIFQGSGKKTLTYDDTDNALLTNKLSGVRSHRVMVSFVVPFGK